MKLHVDDGCVSHNAKKLMLLGPVGLVLCGSKPCAFISACCFVGRNAVRRGVRDAHTFVQQAEDRCEGCWKARLGHLHLYTSLLISLLLHISVNISAPRLLQLANAKLHEL
jgi:hypothetical protein